LNAPATIDRVALVHDLASIENSAIPDDISTLIDEISALENTVINHDKYESLKNRLRALSLFYGFFDFSFPLHKLAITPNAENTASTVLIHWIFFFGERYKFGDVEYLEFTDAEPLVNEVKTFEKGDFFEQSKVSNFSIDLQSTNYFRRAIARANAEESEDFYVPIEVILTPKPRDKYNFGVGVSTDTGPRFTAEWHRPWVNLGGHSLNTNLFVSRPQQSIESSYRIPKGNPLKDFLDVQLGYRLVDDNQTRSDTLSLALLRQFGAKSEDEWDFIPFIRFSQEGFEQGIDADRFTTRLLTPGVTYSRVRKRGDILVSWGDRQQITVSGGSTAAGSDIDFAKIQVQTKWIRQWQKHRVILRAEAGAIATNDFDRLPSSERFFAGGDQSIRGFGLDEISDFNEQINEDGETEFELIGGRYLGVLSAEYAYSVSENWQAAVFVDVGSASDEFAKDIAYGFGAGVHWLSPIGRVRLYVAQGESELEDTSPRIHLSIGPGL
ncbi:MAG: BamA/TamA family outer membrane protein, partial [Pseudomonadota bacterium]